MLNKSLHYYLVIILFASNILFAQEDELAVVTKNNGSVKYKKNLTKVFKTRVNPGLELYNNDLLITGKNGFLMFAYLDDGSLIKMHKNSEVYINGNLQNKSINKEVIIDDGFIKFDIKKQKQKEFTVVTSTSVASVKGTLFYIDSESEKDVFYGFDGIVEVLNRESNQTSQLLKSKKITSLSDGTLTIENISPQDLEYIKEVQLESGVQIEEIESEQEDLDETGSLDEGTVQELVIILTNADGEEKKLIIKFTE